MNEFLSTLLQAVLIAAVPVISVEVVKGVQALAKHLIAKTDNELAKKYLKEVDDAITEAVAFTSQTYVDTLKKSGKFTGENQEEARKKSLEKATALLTADARKFLEEAYGDLNTYLLIRIEPEVRRQKKDETSGTEAVPAATTVAAAAAAATAATVATVAQNTIAQVAAAIEEVPAADPGVEGEAAAAEDAPPQPEMQEFYFGLGEEKIEE